MFRADSEARLAAVNRKIAQLESEMRSDEVMEPETHAKSTRHYYIAQNHARAESADIKPRVWK